MSAAHAKCTRGESDGANSRQRARSGPASIPVVFPRYRGDQIDKSPALLEEKRFHPRQQRRVQYLARLQAGSRRHLEQPVDPMAATDRVGVAAVRQPFAEFLQALAEPLQRAPGRRWRRPQAPLAQISEQLHVGGCVFGEQRAVDDTLQRAVVNVVRIDRPHQIAVGIHRQIRLRQSGAIHRQFADLLPPPADHPAGVRRVVLVADHLHAVMQRHRSAQCSHLGARHRQDERHGGAQQFMRGEKPDEPPEILLKALAEDREPVRQTPATSVRQPAGRRGRSSRAPP